MQQAETQRSG